MGPLKDPLLDDIADFAKMDKVCIQLYKLDKTQKVLFWILQALQTLGLSEGERMQIYTVVAAVLHLGNVAFEGNFLSLNF